MKYKILYRCRACSQFFRRETQEIADEDLPGWLNEVSTHYCKGLTGFTIGVGVVVAFEQVQAIIPLIKNRHLEH